MTDTEFIKAFESCTFPPTAFHHRDHVRLAWIYLREWPLVEALARFTASIKRFAAHNGAAGLYHETITFAFLFLIHERMQRSEAATFEAFAAESPELFAWKPSILDRYYRPETLQSELARRTFVMPDQAGSSTPSSPMDG